MGRSLYQKVFKNHIVKQLTDEQYQLFIGLHMIHEVTSPQAFAILTERKLEVLYPHRTFATVDHIIPTLKGQRQRPYQDEKAEEMMAAIEANTGRHGVSFAAPGSGHQGVVHVIGPESGLTQPGMTMACGDSHTSTHGAFGCLAFGIGTSQVADVLATQTIRAEKLKTRKIIVSGALQPGVYAKDVILAIIRKLTVNGGVGFAYEYAGPVIEKMSMEERMTVCNMSIEGGAKVGYINPDQITIDYLDGKHFSPKEDAFNKAKEFWLSMASDPDAEYDDVVEIPGGRIEPHVTWGIHPGQSVMIDERLPRVKDLPAGEQTSAREAYDYMSFTEADKIKGTKIDVAFIGSCTNGRLSDFEEVARLVEGRRLARQVKGLAVPGSEQVKKEAEQKGLDKILTSAGFEWREPGCSLCLAMNPDKLTGSQVCAATSNRNFKGRQGSPTGRTILMSPAMVAAAGIEGRIADAREVFKDKY
ncbi:3-isopropylmalate dehydratase large subunit [Fibrobacterota bacterium]